MSEQNEINERFSRVLSEIRGDPIVAATEEEKKDVETSYIVGEVKRKPVRPRGQARYEQRLRETWQRMESRSSPHKHQYSYNCTCPDCVSWQDRKGMNEKHAIGDIRLMNANSSKWSGYIKIHENNPKNNDIPSLEHGTIHCYTLDGDYLGWVGTWWLQRNSTLVKKVS